MHRLMTHLRGLMVALAALALTAGVAFAARPAASGDPDLATNAPTTSEVAEEGEGTVPELNDDEDESTDEDADEDESTDEDTDDADEDATDDADEITVDDAADTEHPMNHGWYVSQVAKAETPEGYRNHGEYVSEVARSDAGKPGSEDEAEADTDDSATATTVKSKGTERAAQAKAHKAEREASHKNR